MRISIAIATYNRADELERTLSSLALVDQSGLDDFEVLVIDNNSNDSTAEVARRMSDLFGGRLRRVLESKQGLSHARNRAISEARLVERANSATANAWRKRSACCGSTTSWASTNSATLREKPHGAGHTRESINKSINSRCVAGSPATALASDGFMHIVGVRCMDP